MSTAITTDITGSDAVALVAYDADGVRHITGTNIATALNITGDSTSLTGMLGAEFCCYAASNGATISAGGSGDVPLDTVARSVSGYSVSSGEVTLPDAATYRVSFDVEAEWFTDSTKGHMPCVLQTNNGGSYADVPGSKVSLQNVGSSTQDLFQRYGGTCVGIYLTTTSTNKKIKIRLGAAAASGSDLGTLAGSCRLLVAKVLA